MTINLCYTESLFKECVRYYFRREYFQKCRGLFILAALIPLTDFFVPDVWFWILTALPIVALVGLFAIAYKFRIQEGLKKLAALEKGQITLTLANETVSTEAANGKTELKWKAFNELWEAPCAYLLVFANRHFLILPKDQIPPEAVAYIRDHLKPSLT